MGMVQEPNDLIWLTQPLREMGTRILPAGKRQPEHKVDEFTAICEPIV
jgi:hypothetical protein